MHRKTHFSTIRRGANVDEMRAIFMFRLAMCAANPESVLYTHSSPHQSAPRQHHSPYRPQAALAERPLNYEYLVTPFGTFRHPQKVPQELY